MKVQTLTDPREIRKLLTEVAYMGSRVDGTSRSNMMPSIACTMVRTMRDGAQHGGLSGEDHMTLLAYHALLGYEKTMDMLLEKEMLSPGRVMVDVSKVGQ